MRSQMQSTSTMPSMGKALGHPPSSIFSLALLLLPKDNVHSHGSEVLIPSLYNNFTQFLSS